MKRTLRLLGVGLTLSAISLSCSSDNASNNEVTKTGPTETEQATSEDFSIGLPSGPIAEDLQQIKLPKGFRIDYYAKDVENARSMALSESGILFVGTRSNDKVFAVVDKDRDGNAEEVVEVASGLNSPNGVAIHKGDLYVGEINRVIKYPNIEQTFRDKPKFEVVNDKFPSDAHHGWKYIAFGPDDKLYVPVGAPCNICKSENPIYASITRMNADGSDLEIYAEGVRNTVGFAWHPETKNLYFTDNGRDMLGDNTPADELNRATEKGQHFGYPYCHAGDVADPEFGKQRPCSEFVQPVQKLSPHGGTLGMKFYTGNMFPAEYKNHAFIAEHGSWNRTEKIGYRVMLAKMDNSGNVTSFEPFATGWLQGQDDWGRPVDVLQMKDGSLLVSDDKNNAIYRITHTSQN
ncbi:PQQ-dependent sugar dehydrogenase [Pontibacter akesuensis]|uniref:Glucose/arabinose dehydrogenase, beta-propeller fold n=1 Tax=Pontibacter akesuensis TaxID=388950 RepID=A0A1I7K462_9BACT|nr:sorbosone dehydrogenase family protein [Pontibacter akesuensis]GHA75210.1 sorbosone dehydrogenase [Pontibacter akesuensis]SFU92211.1 Glucose/arabinose dehydrogenase, beta-propeller fold [Pontibacter akesuensis]